MSDQESQISGENLFDETEWLGEAPSVINLANVIVTYALDYLLLVVCRAIFIYSAASPQANSFFLSHLE